MIAAEHVHQLLQLMRREDDAVNEHLSQIVSRRKRQTGVTVGAGTPRVINASTVAAKIAATMNGEQFEIRVTLEHAVEDEVVQRQCRLQRVADNIVEIEPG